jgi:hypothetical protein
MNRREQEGTEETERIGFFGLLFKTLPNFLPSIFYLSFSRKLRLRSAAPLAEMRKQRD